LPLAKQARRAGTAAHLINRALLNAKVARSFAVSTTSRRSPVWAVLCAYKADKVKVSAKEDPSQPAGELTRTLVFAHRIIFVTPRESRAQSSLLAAASG